MTTPPDEHPDDDQQRPADPAGTQPKHDPTGLRPSRPLRAPARQEGAVVEGDAIDDGQEPVPADEGDLLPQRRAAGGLGAVRAPKVAPPHASRFHFLYGALAALAFAVVAAGVLAYAAARDDDAAQRRVLRWSAWHPTSRSVDGAGQIAGHVERQYRLPDGRQLVSVNASGMDFEGVPLSVAIRQTAEQGGDIRIFSDDGVIYRLCGLGPNCSIAAGKASKERHLLLRREALELALYSFRYLGGVDQVAVLMPPPRGKTPSEAVFFRRDDVGPQLDRPLTASLAPRTPGVSTVVKSADARLVDRLTGVHTFAFSLVPANTQRRGFLVLDPVAVPPQK